MSHKRLCNDSSIYDLIGSANILAGIVKAYPVSPDPTYICSRWERDYSLLWYFHNDASTRMLPRCASTMALPTTANLLTLSRTTERWAITHSHAQSSLYQLTRVIVMDLSACSSAACSGGSLLVMRQNTCSTWDSCSFTHNSWWLVNTWNINSSIMHQKVQL